MPLPWVSRALFVEVSAQRSALELEVSRLTAERDSWIERCVDAMAPAEPVPPSAVPPEPAPPSRAKSLVAEAIKEESGGDTRLAAWYRKRAKEMKAEGKSEGDIVAAIRSWETTEDTHQPASE